MTEKINRNALKIDVIEKQRVNSLFFERICNVLMIPRGSKILEVGCGGGELLALMSRAGFDCYGIEPYPQYSFQFDETRIMRGYSEEIPFENGAFDLVVAKDVLEHVSDVTRSVVEMIRVSKKYVYIMSPNYCYPYEAHFKVPFFPFMPKPIARIYLRLLGFSKDDVSFVNHINYVTKFSVMNAVKRIDGVSAVFDLQLSKRRTVIGPLVAIMDLFGNYKFELLIVKK